MYLTTVIISRCAVSDNYNMIPKIHTSEIIAKLRHIFKHQIDRCEPIYSADKSVLSMVDDKMGFVDTEPLSSLRSL